jgi:hypothetical protein
VGRDERLLRNAPIATIVEREVWVRAGMVLSTLVLVALILVTPQILGQPTPELASLPLLIIGMTKNESAFIVSIGSAFQAYRYELIRADVNGTDLAMNWTDSVTEEYGLSMRVPGNSSFSLHVYIVDQERERNYFEYNVSVATEKDVDNRTVMVFMFPYEEPMISPIRVAVPFDFRQPIPWRGTLEEVA